MLELLDTRTREPERSPPVIEALVVSVRRGRLIRFHAHVKGLAHIAAADRVISGDAILVGRLHSMRVTIDAAGRLVIPKALRDRLVLRGGEELEIDARDDHLEIRRAGSGQPLVETRGGLRTMATGPGFDPDQVRDLVERDRR
ncbi:MAG: AbrB/MazE/SpoVT family DNA-binding domain-containing protein [Actinobacteria bacterium]|nr:AbrB/MazE/SpoVT family DNA-binding domain-containing protein [Actinomycetota bacterium]